MKSICAHLGAAPRTIALRELELEPREDQVLVRVTACGICRGDIIEFGQPRERESTFGHEAVGQVVARGPWVRGLKEGDWVVGSIWPGFATFALAPEGGLFKAPAEFSRTGALVEPLKCVTTVVRAAAAELGDVVAVVGCGFMGLAAVADLAGGYVRDLIAVDASEPRLKLARAFGATVTLNPASCDAPSEVRRLTGGRGADAVIEFAGNAQAATMAANMVRTQGRLVVAGGRIPRADGQGLYDPLYINAFTTHYAPPMFSPDPAGDWHRTMESMARQRFPLDRLMTHVSGLGRIQAAFEAAASGDNGRYIKGIVVSEDEQKGANE